MPAPSAGTNPSRSASKGRLARCGSSLRALRARITANPARPSWLMPASAPPVSITSATPWNGLQSFADGVVGRGAGGG